MMISAQRVTLGAALIGSLGLAGCGGSLTSPLATAPPPQPVMAPTVTADGTEQFAVPPEGRAVIRQKVLETLGTPAEQGSLSNAWRTAAGAQARPNDYAACASTVVGGVTRYFIVVVSGTAVSGFVAGPKATENCADPNRVVQWQQFPEVTAMAAGSPGPAPM